MNDSFKKFIAEAAKGLGLNPNEVAFECIAATMNLPSMAKYLNGAKPPACRFDVALPAPAPAENTDNTAEIAGLNTTINALKTEIDDLVAEKTTLQTRIDTMNATPAAADTTDTTTAAVLDALKAELDALKTEVAALKAGKPVKAPKAPKEPKAAKEPKEPKAATGLMSDNGKLKAIIINGTETELRSWRAGALHMLNLAAEAGKKGDLPRGWFKAEANPRTVTLPSGDFAFASLVLEECEKRIVRIKDLLSLNVTLRILRDDGGTTEIAL